MKKFSEIAKPLLLFFLISACVGSSMGYAAEVKVLDSFSPAMVERHLSALSDDANSANVALQNSFNKFAGSMDVSTVEAIAESVRSLDAAESAALAARKSSAAMSSYVTDNRARFTDNLVKIIPLGDLYRKVEAPYLDAMSAFFTASKKFLVFVGANFALIKEGSEKERQQYDLLYANYAKALEKFNAANAKHAERLSSFINKNRELMELLPQ
jgi:hypothetical protein